MPAVRPSAGAEAAAGKLAEWAHVLGPLDLWGVYETLTDGLVQAKRAYREARSRHDDAAAARQLAEIADLNALCAVAAEGVALMRLRYFASGSPWPLSRI